MRNNVFYITNGLFIFYIVLVLANSPAANILCNPNSQ